MTNPTRRRQGVDRSGVDGGFLDMSVASILGYLPSWRSGLIIPEPQYRQEGILWNIHGANSLEPTFAFFLLFEQFALSGDITAITF